MVSDRSTDWCARWYRCRLLWRHWRPFPILVLVSKQLYCYVVFTHSNNYFDRHVWFDVRSAMSSNIRVVRMLGESQRWLAVATQRHSMLPEKFSIFNFDVKSLLIGLYMDFVCNLVASLGKSTGNIASLLNKWLCVCVCVYVCVLCKKKSLHRYSCLITLFMLPQQSHCK